MGRFPLAILVTVYATLASAAELPARKPGLWEVTMSSSGPHRPGAGDPAMHRRRDRPDDAVERGAAVAGRLSEA